MRLLLAALLVSLAACSSNDKKDQDIGPNALTGFDKEISLTTQWRGQVGDGLGSAFARLQPALKNDVLYAASANGVIQALALDSGSVIWEQNFDAEVTAAVAVGNSNGYFATSNGESLLI